MSLGTIELELSPEAKQQLTAFGEAFERFTQQLVEVGMLFARLCEQHRGALSLADSPAGSAIAGEAMPQVEPAQPIPPPAAPQPAGVMQTALADAALAKWTPERLAILQADYPAGVAVPDILARLLALPGIAIGHKEVAIKAAQKGWRRPAAAPDDAAVPEEAAPLRKWTAERMRVLERDYPNGMVLPMLRKAINALPGLPVGESDIVAQAVATGIRRKPVAAPPPRVTAKETLKKLSDPMIVSRDHARRWGAERGITTPTLDLEAINAKRRSLGLGAFVLER